MIARLNRLGIQKRIMLYVTLGLVLMFGGIAFIGLAAIQDATRLVYEERLGTAYTTAGILTRDFLHVARDVIEAKPGLTSGDQKNVAIATRNILDHLSGTDPFPFFAVTGVWVLDPQGNVLAEAGEPQTGRSGGIDSVVLAASKVPEGDFAVLPSPAGPPGQVPFGIVVTRVSGFGSSTLSVVGVHTVSLNRPTPYNPASYWRLEHTSPPSTAKAGGVLGDYHLEVLRPDGVAVLGIGKDERPGETSLHFDVIQPLTREGKATTLLHEPGIAQTFEAHVMAVVPISSSPYFLVVEQPKDVALAMPLKLRQRLMLFTGVGFFATLLVAWVTTRHVVRPTEQLTSAARRIAQGDLETPIDVRAQDEVGKLAESLDTMRQKLRAAYQRVETANQDLERQVRERTARLEEVLGKVISAQEEERYRLSRELHDETAQTLGALSIALDRARDSLPDAAPAALEQLAEAKSIAGQLLEETRRLILDLRPVVLDDMGLGPAIRWYVETHLQEKGVEAVVELEHPPARLPKHLEVTIFRIVQEAVNNVARHADARHAAVGLGFRDSVALVQVSDDGKGFDVNAVLFPGPANSTVGLLGMQERVRLLKGRLEIRSEEGRGTQIRVEIPLAEERS